MAVTYTLCTTFSEAHAPVYGGRFVNSVLRFWPKDQRFFRGTDEFVHAQPEFELFVEEAKRHPPPRSDFYRYDAVKFAYKVLTITAATRADDWLIWLDADTEIVKEITLDWLAHVCPEGYTASYLGRQDWDHSELGWCAYNLRAGGREFLDRLRWYYTSGAIWKLDQWHDSYVWDRVREEFEVMGYAFHNLSVGVPGNHVWPHTKLAERIIHHKGPQRKIAAYGEAA